MLRSEAEKWPSYAIIRENPYISVWLGKPTGALLKLAVAHHFYTILFWVQKGSYNTPILISGNVYFAGNGFKELAKSRLKVAR